MNHRYRKLLILTGLVAIVFLFWFIQPVAYLKGLSGQYSKASVVGAFPAQYETVLSKIHSATSLQEIVSLATNAGLSIKQTSDAPYGSSAIISDPASGMTLAVAKEYDDTFGTPTTTPLVPIPTTSSLDTATTTKGILSFSPAKVTNNQSFNISATGAPANTQTDIMVDNGDGKGFQDFGSWVSTNASGAISATRTLDCTKYVTYVPGVVSNISGKIVTQKVYLKYLGTNFISPTTTHTKDCSATVTQIVPVVTATPVIVIPPPPPPSANTQGTLSFFPTTVTNGQQMTVALTGAPANTQTDIMVDNGDGKGFQDFGPWLTTNAAGGFSVTSAFNCTQYLTYVLGQISNISGKVVTQNAYLRYVGTALVSPTVTVTKDCSALSPVSETWLNGQVLAMTLLHNLNNLIVVPIANAQSTNGEPQVVGNDTGSYAECSVAGTNGDARVFVTSDGYISGALGHDFNLTFSGENSTLLSQIQFENAEEFINALGGAQAGDFSDTQNYQVQVNFHSENIPGLDGVAAAVSTLQPDGTWNYLCTANISGDTSSVTTKVIEHEILHCMGLAHNDDPNNIMSGDAGGGEGLNPNGTLNDAQLQFLHDVSTGQQIKVEDCGACPDGEKYSNAAALANAGMGCVSQSKLCGDQSNSVWNEGTQSCESCGADNFANLKTGFCDTSSCNADTDGSGGTICHDANGVSCSCDTSGNASCTDANGASISPPENICRGGCFVGQIANADGKCSVDCTQSPNDPSCMNECSSGQVKQADGSCAVDCTQNPTDPSCQKVDCAQNPDDPSCQNDYCAQNPDDSNCPSYCSSNPDDTSCQGNDVCAQNPDDPSCQGNDICDSNPDDPSCNTNNSGGGGGVCNDTGCVYIEDF